MTCTCTFVRVRVRVFVSVDAFFLCFPLYVSIYACYSYNSPTAPPCLTCMPSGNGCYASLAGHVDYVTSLAASAAGDRLASGGLRGQVLLWDMNVLHQVLDHKLPGVSVGHGVEGAGTWVLEVCCRAAWGRCMHCTAWRCMGRPDLRSLMSCKARLTCLPNSSTSRSPTH